MSPLDTSKGQWDAEGMDNNDNNVIPFPIKPQVRVTPFDLITMILAHPDHPANKKDEGEDSCGS